MNRLWVTPKLEDRQERTSKGGGKWESMEFFKPRVKYVSRRGGLNCFEYGQEIIR